MCLCKYVYMCVYTYSYIYTHIYTYCKNLSRNISNIRQQCFLQWTLGYKSASFYQTISKWCCLLLGFFYSTEPYPSDGKHPEWTAPPLGKSTPYPATLLRGTTLLWPHSIWRSKYRALVLGEGLRDKESRGGGSSAINNPGAWLHLELPRCRAPANLLCFLKQKKQGPCSGFSEPLARRCSSVYFLPLEELRALNKSSRSLETLLIPEPHPCHR